MANLDLCSHSAVPLAQVVQGGALSRSVGLVSLTDISFATLETHEVVASVDFGRSSSLMIGVMPRDIELALLGLGGLLMRSTTWTSSPTRSRAPLGPAHAY